MIIILLHDMIGEMVAVLPVVVGAITIPEEAVKVVRVIKAAEVHQAVAAMQVVLQQIEVAVIPVVHQQEIHAAIPVDRRPVIPIGLPGDHHQEEINHPGKKL